MRPFNPGEDFQNIVASALPGFVKADYDTFVEFIKAFAAFLDVPRTFTSEQVFPEYGQTQNTVTQQVTTAFGGPAYEIRKLLEYKDIATSLDEFKVYFLSMFAKNFPQFSYIPTDLLIRSLRQFYQSKGTTESIEWFFRVFFNEPANVYFPREDILKASDGTWQAPITLKVSSPLPDPATAITPNNSSVMTFYTGQRVETSTGSAQVESVVTTIVGQAFNQRIVVNELTLKFGTILGTFSSGQVLHNIDSTTQIFTTILPVISDTLIESGGSNYAPGDVVEFSEGPTGGGGFGAAGVVEAVASTALNGVQIDDGGDGYIVGTPVTLTSTTGSGASAVVSQVIYGVFLLEDGTGFWLAEDSTSASPDYIIEEDKNTFLVGFSIEPFIDTQNTATRDLGSDARNGTYAVGMTRDVSGPFTVDDFTAIATASNAEFITVSGGNFSTSTPFTVEAWIKTSNLAQQPVFTSDDGTHGLFFGTNTGKVFASSNGVTFTGTANVATNAWTYIAITCNGSTMISYVNGVADISGAFAFTAGAVPAFVAHSGGVPADAFIGSLDEVAYYSAVLTPTDIANHYAARRDAFDYRTAVLASSPDLYYTFNDTGVFIDDPDYGITSGIADLDGLFLDGSIEIALDAGNEMPFMHPWVFTNPLHTTVELANAATTLALVGNTFFANGVKVFAISSLTDQTTNLATSTLSANTIVSDITTGQGIDVLYLKQITGAQFLDVGKVFKEDGTGTVQLGTISTTAGSANVVGNNTIFTTLAPNAHLRFDDGSHNVVRAVVNNTFLQTFAVVGNTLIANVFSAIPTGTITNVDLQAQKFYGKIRQITMTATGDHYVTLPIVTAIGVDAEAQQIDFLDPDPTGNTANNQIVAANGQVQLYQQAILEALQSAGQVAHIKITSSGVGYTDANSVVITVLHGGDRTGANAVVAPVFGALTQYPGIFTTTRGFLSSDKFLEDASFYNEFTYVVRVAESFERYKQIILHLLHPAGFQPLGQFVETQVSPAPPLSAEESLTLS